MSSKIAQNLINIGVHAYLSNGCLNPFPKLNFKKVDKIGVHAYLSNGYLNPLSNFNYEKVDKSAYF